ncbi:hypothetical protein [Sphingomonas sp. 3-13AW]|uniref:hypothetical protein n=1 Tax=Sphingomonas sp. 3-13AW TaxID=3050450 RepID=UPI003BB4925A
MTMMNNGLPDLIVCTAPDGDRFSWSLVTMDEQLYLTSKQHSLTRGTTPNHETRGEARQAAGAVLIALVEENARAETQGEVVPLSTSTQPKPARLAA